MPQENNKEKTPLEVAEEKLQKAKEEVRELKEKYTVRGVKKAINSAYNALYADKELTEEQKIRKLFGEIEQIRNDLQV